MNDVTPSHNHDENGITAEEEQKVVQALQDVIEVNVASRDALKGLAGDVEDLTIAATLRTIAGQRQRQANELKRFVQYERGEVSQFGRTSAHLNRFRTGARGSYKIKSWLSVVGTYEFVRLGSPFPNNDYRQHQVTLSLGAGI